MVNDKVDYVGCHNLLETPAMEEVPVPALTTEEMREVDRLMVYTYGISLVQMMENAGRNLALLAAQMLEHDVESRPVVVLAGRGNNGGGGLAAARHLHNWGAWVQVLCTHPPSEYEGVPAHQLAILQALDVPASWADEGWELPPCDLVIDAVMGYGIRGEPHGRARDLIQLANSSLAPVLSLDVPSGVDSSTGKHYDPFITAAATMTLALPKRGLLVEEATGVCGDLYLADISVPPDLYAHLDLDVKPYFAQGSIVSLDVVRGQAFLRSAEGIR